MPELLDVYHLARYLRERNAVEQIEDVYHRYTHIEMLEDCYPVFVMNTTGPDSACVFLKDGRCGIYEARPRVCACIHSTHFPDSGAKPLRFIKAWTNTQPTTQGEKFWSRTGCTRISNGRTGNF